MYPLHTPQAERPARKPTEPAPASLWSSPGKRGAPARPAGSRSERRRLAAVFLVPAWPALVMWTSVFYLVADMA
jgi:hypothetical protein